MVFCVLSGLDDVLDGILIQGWIELNIYFNVFQGLLDFVDLIVFVLLYKDECVLLIEIVGVLDDVDCLIDNMVLNVVDVVDYLFGLLVIIIVEIGFVIEGENMFLVGIDLLVVVMNVEFILDVGVIFLLIIWYFEGFYGNLIFVG